MYNTKARWQRKLFSCLCTNCACAPQAQPQVGMLHDMAAALHHVSTWVVRGVLWLLLGDTQESAPQFVAENKHL